MLIRNSALIKTALGVPRAQRGCVVDTNVLFAASFPLDAFNEWAESLVALLHKLEIPLFTNINVRSEFIDLCRRVMIPEGLVGLHCRKNRHRNGGRHDRESIYSLESSHARDSRS